jgi:copper chaperone NosL
MTISDVRYGGEIVTAKGRVHTFDAVECLASYFKQLNGREPLRAIWVSDYSTGNLIPVDSAAFLWGGTIRSPMGHALIAVGRDSLEAFRTRFRAQGVSWTEVLEIVAKDSR